MDELTRADRESALTYRVVLARDGGWDVLAERGQCVVWSAHCTDWHRVERFVRLHELVKH
jgi:hypothetical protein